MANMIINNNGHIGTSISVINGKVFIDGKEVKLEDQKTINISIDGVVDNLSVDVCSSLQVKGHVNTIKTASANVICHNVDGNINTTSGDVDCEDVKGSVQTVSGDVSAKIINGDVKTVSGDIKHKRN